MEGYIEICGNFLIVFIKGGSLIERVFGEFYIFDGLDFWDFDDINDDEIGYVLYYYWFC